MNATPIRPGVLLSPRKQQFLDYVAEMFDKFAEALESEPSAMVFGFCNNQGEAASHWIMPDEEPSCLCTMKHNRIAVVIMQDAMRSQ